MIINLFYIFAVDVNIVLLRYFSLQIEPLNNNGVRFLSGATLLFIWIFIRYRTSLIQLLKSPKLLSLTLFIGVLMCANMYFYLKGVSITNAVTASIFGAISMPFGILVAGFFFQDERQKIKNKQFWIGCFLTLFGCLGFIWYGKNLEMGDAFLVGSFFLFLSLFIRNLQNLFVKFTNNKLNAITLSCFTSLSTAFLSLFISVQTGQIAEFQQISPLFLGGLILFGIYAITMGMALPFYIIQKQGIITYQILELLLPISTAIIAYILLGESLSFIQLIFAGIVIFGAGLALKLLPSFHLRKSND